jgi:two-component system nitrogen regulation response regulator GlnG
MHTTGDWSGAYALGVRILAHPDVQRVGESALLFDAPSVGSVQLSRQEPVFCASGGRASGPLESLRVSRRPVHLQKDGDGGVRIMAEDAAGYLLVDEAPLRDVQTLPPARLANGVLLRLGKHVLLWLGWLPTAPASTPFPELLGHSRAMTDLRDEISRVSDLGVSVLLRGESGVGKETVARAIHKAGPRAAGPFVAVNAGSILPATASLELWGDGSASEGGIVGRADGGTLFLDELSSAHPDVQSLLARVLDGAGAPFASAATSTPSVRVIAASEDDPASSNGTARIRTVLLRRFEYELTVPPLRARRGDIAELFMAFTRAEMEQLGDLEQLARASRGDDTSAWIPASLVATLVLRDWAGNLRELRNAARRFAVFNRGRSRSSVPGDFLGHGNSDSELPPRNLPERKVSVADLTDEHISESLRRNSYVVDATAEDLGVSRSWLHTHLNESPAFRKAKDLTEQEIQGALAEHGGDLTAAALGLRVSRRGLQLQMSRFGMRSTG